MKKDQQMAHVREKDAEDRKKSLNFSYVDVPHMIFIYVCLLGEGSEMPTLAN